MSSAITTTEAPPSELPIFGSAPIPMSTGFPKKPTFATKLEEREWLKKRLAQALRIFAHEGFDEGVAGHITVRDPVEPNTFWVNPFGLHFGLIQADDLLRVDHQANIIDHGRVKLLNTAAFMIHSAIHEARPDVLCAAHSHTIYGRAFSALGIPLDITTQDATAFYEDHVVYDSFKGLVLEQNEGREIAALLGTKKAAILQNHGLLVATGSIEATVYFFTSLEKCCRIQLLADAAAAARGIKTVHIGDKEAKETWKTVGSELGGWFAGLPAFDMLEARESGGLKPRSSSS